MGEDVFDKEISLFVWDGMAWSGKIIFERMFWLLLSICITCLAATPFDRFDPNRSQPTHKPQENGTQADETQKSSEILATATALTPLSEHQIYWRFGSVFLAELRLLLKGKKWGWYAGVLGIIISGATIPLDYALSYVLPFAWLWPLLIWSSLGVRETRYFTSPIVFSAPHALTRQLPATWLAGIFVALLMASGVGAQLIRAGEIPQLLALIVGALFIPALALTLGVWSGSSRLFESIYLIWWYLMMNGVSALDFIGIMNKTKLPLSYLGLTFLLLIIATLRRQQEIQN